MLMMIRAMAAASGPAAVKTPQEDTGQLPRRTAPQSGWTARRRPCPAVCPEPKSSAGRLGPQPSALILVINSASTISALSLAIWQVPAFSCPPLA